MNSLRRLIRSLLIETNKKAVDGQTMWVKLDELIPLKLSEIGADVEHFETDMMSDMKFFGEWQFEGVSVEEIEKLKPYFSDWLDRRGWNLLRWKVEAARGWDTGGRFHFIADMQANPKSKNLVWSMFALAEEEQVLLHITPTKYVNSIKSKGFKPSRVSTDGITFGGQRNYFFVLEKRAWKEHKEEIVTYLQVRFNEGKGRQSMAGIKEEDISLIVTDPWYLSSTDNPVTANFYRDTEFGYGTGGINTEGFEWELLAVYTPTHFIPRLPEVIKL